MKTLKGITDSHAETLADEIIEMTHLDRKELTTMISTRLSMFHIEMSRTAVANLTNTLGQIEENLRTSSDPQKRKALKERIASLNREIGQKSTVVNELSRENRYRRLRNYLKENGQEGLLAEYDRMLTAEKETQMQP